MVPRLSPAWRASAALCLAAVATPPVAAQSARAQGVPAQRARLVAGVPLAGSETEERLRLAAALDSIRAPGTASSETAARWMFRSPSMLLRALEPPAPSASHRRVTLQLLAPELRTVHNSDIPHSLGDGTLWAGRGTSTLVTAGLALRVGPVHLVLAPQHTTSANTRFQVIPYVQGITPARSVWANPFLGAPHSIDLPFRFGNQRLTRTVPGQSALAVDLPGATLSVGTEQLTWGPGVRNQLLLGGNAEGFPHATLTTRQGLRTPVGRLHAQWLVGRLQESAFFDSAPDNDFRALGGALLQLTPRGDSAFTVGIARLVMSSQDGPAPRLGSAFRVFAPVGRPGAPGTSREQVTALFARWLVAPVGAEAYVEWARFAEPASLRDLLEYPGHSQGYTVGVLWARPLRGGALQLNAEATQLEQDASARMRDAGISYTSRVIPQGWTHRGRVLGAAIGPGSSSQWVSADWYGGRLRLGAYAARIRWNNDVLWTPVVPQPKLEDITLLSGVRASATVGRTRVLLDYARGARLAYLYQARPADFARGTNVGVDFLNQTFSVTLVTHAGR